jgi:DNA-binding FadR family transcriptional regulator
MVQVQHDNGAVVRRLIDYIRSQGLTVGDRLPSFRRLAAQFRVGTNAVRDAMVQAQTMGLIRIHPRSGAFVQSLSFAPLVDALAVTLETSLFQADNNFFHVLDARQQLEIGMAGRAAERRSLEGMLPLRQALDAMRRTGTVEDRPECVSADIKFHLAVAQLAGNPVLTIVLQGLLGLLRPLLLSWPWSEEGWQRTDLSHSEIYRAILDRDADRARQAMKEHQELAYKHLLREIELPATLSALSG